MRFVILYAYRT